VFIGSADWMPRNLFKRIEVVFPITDGNLRERIANEFLALPLADNVKARFLQADGSYRRARRKRGDTLHQSQAELIALALGEPKFPNGRHGPKSNYPKMKVAPRPA
jgi:polyphosphate kinase